MTTIPATRPGPTRGTGRLPPERIAAILATLMAHLDEDRPRNIGFPGSFAFDITSLLPLFNRVLNNIGDPYQPSAYPANTLALEQDLVGWVADLLGAPADDRWGYVTTGGTEGNEYGLHLGRELLPPTAMTYYNRAAHYSVPKILARLRMPAIAINCGPHGDLDYDDLTAAVRAHRDRPAIVLATIGTTMTEAVDDVSRIRQILRTVPITQSYIHADAALPGLPLALLNQASRPGFTLADGSDSISVSGHKFIGAPFPCGVVVTRASLRTRIGDDVDYIGTADTTVSGSRSGHAALVLWYQFSTLGTDGLRRRAEEARDVAAYAYSELVRIGWPGAHRHQYAFTVVFDSPPPAIATKWRLATGQDRSHLIAMPGVTTDQIDLFIQDLEGVLTRTRTAGNALNGRPPAPRPPYPRDGST